MFAWFRRRRRRKILANPFPDSWRDVLDGVPHVRTLARRRRRDHQDATQIFLAEKVFEGCGGLVVDDRMRVVVAGLACLMVLGTPESIFENVATILMYPDAFAVPNKVPIAGDVALEEESDRLGEAHYRGPVILAWAEIEEDLHEPGHGRNLVIHEFAHQLDMLNGEADGVPLLPAELQEPWAQVMAKEYRRLQKRSRRRETLIDPYGATEPAEFFAVVSEAFFDSPADLAIEHPELYDVLRRYYHLDPARLMAE